MESLRIALEMERRGYQLYHRALRFVKDPDLIDLLTKLAQDEADHFAFFRELYDQQPKNQTTEEPLPDLEASLAAEAFYPGGLMQAAMEGALESVPALYETAIGAEEDSIAFYETLLPSLAQTHHDTIRRIIHEEQRHRDELKRRRDRLAGA